MDNAIADAITGGDIKGLVKAEGYVSSIFVGFEEDFEYIDKNSGVLSVIVDKSQVYTKVIITSNDYPDLYLWTEDERLEPTETKKDEAPYAAIYDRIEYRDTYYYGAVVGGNEQKERTIIDYTGINELEYNA